MNNRIVLLQIKKDDRARADAQKILIADSIRKSNSID